MKYRITTILFLLILMGTACVNWMGFFENRSELLADLDNETDLAGAIEDVDGYIEDHISGEYVFIEAYGSIQKAEGDRGA